MDDESRELMQRLCVIAGSIMEDASVDAISALPDGSEEMSLRLENLKSAAADIRDLILAADVLRRCSLDA